MNYFSLYDAYWLTTDGYWLGDGDDDFWLRDNDYYWLVDDGYWLGDGGDDFWLRVDDYYWLVNDCYWMGDDCYWMGDYVHFYMLCIVTDKLSYFNIICWLWVDAYLMKLGNSWLVSSKNSDLGILYFFPLLQSLNSSFLMQTFQSKLYFFHYYLKGNMFYYTLHSSYCMHSFDHLDHLRPDLSGQQSHFSMFIQIMLHDFWMKETNSYRWGDIC